MKKTTDIFFRTSNFDSLSLVTDKEYILSVKWNEDVFGDFPKEKMVKVSLFDPELLIGKKITLEKSWNYFFFILIIILIRFILKKNGLEYFFY